MRRYALRDDQWERIKDLLPGREGHVGVTAKDNRLFVEAVLYRYRAGIPWGGLPGRFGDPIKLHTRFSPWAGRGGWEKRFEIFWAAAGKEKTPNRNPHRGGPPDKTGAPKKNSKNKA